MRSASLLLVLALGASSAACRDSTPPPPRDDVEVPRGEWRLVVERFSRAGERSYYSMSPGGAMVADEPGYPADAVLLAPSGDGRRLAVLRENPDESVHLWTMDRDGGDRRPVLVGDRVVHHVSWSPVANRLAVAYSTPEINEDIWVMNADGSAAVNLTPDAGSAVIFDRHPAWSPDGTRLAFTSNRSGGQRLWVMDATGTNPRQIIDGSTVASERAPVWSPDGTEIAFINGGDGGAGIGVVRTDGTNRRVFPVAGGIAHLAWSPDGRLIFSAVFDADYDLYAVNPASGVQTRLTTHEDHDFRATPVPWVAPGTWRGFGAPATYATGRQDAAGLVAADVNADGAADVMLLAPAQDEIRVLRNTGSGALAPLGALTAPGDQRLGIAADVAKDGIADLLVLGGGAFSMWRGSAQGPGTATTHPFDGAGRALAIADFDRSGTPDVAAVHEREGRLRMLVHAWREVDETLVAVVDYGSTFESPGAACAGDVTGEGAPDIVVLTARATSPVLLLRGQADITFADPVVAASQGVTADAATIPVCADFDGDRRSDLALLRPGASGSLVVLRSTGSAFSEAIPLGVRGTAIAAADVDRDGDIDLVVAGATGGDALFLRNLGDARFVAPVRIAVGGALLHLALRDLDGDTWPDLVTVDRAGAVSVLLNRRR